MADSANCDRCGADLLGADVHYVAEMKIWAAYDVMEIGTSKALKQRDLHAEYVDALIDAAQLSKEEAQDSVYWSRKFDLCAQCRKQVQNAPLGANGSDSNTDSE